MDPNDLRDCVEQEIRELIEPVAWERCEVVNKPEQELTADDPGEVATRAVMTMSHKPELFANLSMQV